MKRERLLTFIIIIASATFGWGLNSLVGTTEGKLSLITILFLPLLVILILSNTALWFILSDLEEEIKTPKDKR
jgi:hypothetical protein